MPLNIRDEKVNELATELAHRRGVNKTAAVKLALENELQREKNKIPLRERLKPLLDELDKLPRTGLEADKEFYDSLSGDY
ncbi:Rv0623-like transcription factor [Variibacter gotjawalensis]|uniref:Rv0623-like transcription factor n=1 Tax=Variibacter gotjawalensis TaxID=1333996 RepID=A0A0S3PP07_9BRAD|nr:type II toxin-antitoxin system VapB family antitoxin [Variibacter gotjawalensis]NIK47952.1 antitoxin VapB [Variibacter gotjawalensis]RZS49830.1 antitoxin VapB [Variibacter gotjawalensis]BAT57659.1 Rv0623-like transcription factor [Variibacter gotjawalensis]